ncbi:MAG: hypothetical protein HDR05_01285 [Lachnospiraceae bacterium]|nr:hypothetical protein [Lachnospiraceae bacterium]
METINVIFLGSSQLLYNCARKTRNYYEQNVNIKVIDTSDSATQKKKKLQDEFGNTKEYSTKSELFDYLEHIDEHTFLFSINNPYILPKRVCSNQNLTMINLHHALLPRHPGRNAEAWTIYEQDLWGGISWHFLNQKIDSGDIICQRKINITENTTSLKLLRLCEREALDSFDIFLPMSGIADMPKTKQSGKMETPKKASDIPNGGLLNLNWPIDKSLAFLNSLNYAGIDVMGFPKVEYQDTNFTIKSYQIVTKNQDFCKKILYNSEVNTLEIHDRQKYLILNLEQS